jgi:hypothetical protein
MLSLPHVLQRAFGTPRLHAWHPLMCQVQLTELITAGPLVVNCNHFLSVWPPAHPHYIARAFF